MCLCVVFNLDLDICCPAFILAPLHTPTHPHPRTRIILARWSYLPYKTLFLIAGPRWEWFTELRRSGGSSGGLSLPQLPLNFEWTRIAGGWGEEGCVAAENQVPGVCIMYDVCDPNIIGNNCQCSINTIKLCFFECPCSYMICPEFYNFALRI